MQKPHRQAVEQLRYLAQVRQVFHAHVKIKIPIDYGETLFEELFAVLERVDVLYNSYAPGSYIDLINKNAGTFVEVDDETVRLLSQVNRLATVFDGTYDMTLMPLLRLWGFYSQGQAWRIPSEQELDRVLALVDYRKIEIENNRVRIQKGQEIITGSYLKAYAVDKLVERMKQEDITDAMVSAGGSTIMGLNDQRHPFWRVDVPHPDAPANRLFQLKLGNSCLSTSARTVNSIEIDGKRYGHILNAKTGYPSANKQVGVISENGLVGDVLSTGLFNCDAATFSKKMDVLSREFPVSGFLIDGDGKTTFSKGFKENIATV